METSTINKIIDFLFSNGYWAGVFTFLVFTLLYIVFKIISYEKIKDAIALKISANRYKKSRINLKKHHIFLHEALMRNKANSIIFKNEPIKSRVFQEFFKTKLEVDIERIKNFLELDYKKHSSSELYFAMLSLINEMQESFNKQIKIKLTSLCEKLNNNLSLRNSKACSKKLYEYIMNSPKGFLEFRNYRIENLLIEMELIKNSPIYDDNNERLYHFLDILNSSINKSILRAGKIFEDFNGEIEGIIKNETK